MATSTAAEPLCQGLHPPRKERRHGFWCESPAVGGLALPGSRTLPCHTATACRLLGTLPPHRGGMESGDTPGIHPVAARPGTWLHPGKPFSHSQRPWVRHGGCVRAGVSAATRCHPASHLGTHSGGAALGLQFQSQECQRCLPSCSACHKFLPNPHSGTSFLFGFVPFIL